MKRFGIVLILALIWSAGHIPLYNAVVSVAESASACGTERWDVKTLSDAVAPSLLTTTVFTTVDALRAMKVPGACTPCAATSRARSWRPTTTSML
jgi:hypothetical protein